MTLGFDTCYRALQTRDERFDGRFFTDVTSTKMYCRPICPARTPSRRNLRFFPHAGAAEAAGFRACRRRAYAAIHLWSMPLTEAPAPPPARKTPATAAAPRAAARLTRE